MPQAPGIQHAAQHAAPAARAHSQRIAAAFVTTGAYQASGDPAIDRMVRLEAACKRFGSPI